MAVGRSRAAAGFGPDAPRDVNLHREVLYFTSRGGRGPIFFAYGPSVGAAFFAPDGPKVRYFYIWTVYWRCSYLLVSMYFEIQF